MSNDFKSFFDIVLEEINSESELYGILQQLFKLHTEAMYLLGSFTFLNEWAHDRGLDSFCKEYKIADDVIEDVVKKSGKMYLKLSNFKYTGEEQDVRSNSSKSN